MLFTIHIWNIGKWILNRLPHNFRLRRCVRGDPHRSSSTRAGQSRKEEKVLHLQTGQGDARTGTLGPSAGTSGGNTVTKWSEEEKWKWKRSQSKRKKHQNYDLGIIRFVSCKVPPLKLRIKTPIPPPEEPIVPDSAETPYQTEGSQGIESDRSEEDDSNDVDYEGDRRKFNSASIPPPAQTYSRRASKRKLNAENNGLPMPTRLG